MYSDVLPTGGFVSALDANDESENVLGMTATVVDESCILSQTSCTSNINKKKKKKRTRTSKSKTAAGLKANNDHLESKTTSKGNGQVVDDDTSNVFRISRNKHWKYISSYHGPWLQLPIELLESLLLLNLDPDMVTPQAPQTNNKYVISSKLLTVPSPRPMGFSRLRELGSAANSPQISRSSSQNTSGSYYSTTYPYNNNNNNSNSNCNSNYGSNSNSPNESPPLTPCMNLPTLEEGRIPPPPIDPGVFRCVTTIRRRIDEAAELAVRASSANLGGGGGGGGLYGCMGNGGGGGMGKGGEYGNGGRNVPMSSTRVNMLRNLAVQKLAEAYRADEIASSVMVMQRGTVFDEIAERVLKVDPNNVDAQYVHFFHEKIPSRQVAEATPTTVLDKLIMEQPHRLEFFRTRGIVHCFRDEYSLAVQDFTHIIKESRAIRRAKQIHDGTKKHKADPRYKGGKRKKNKINGQAPPNGTASAIEGLDTETLSFHPSVLPGAPEPIESQALFYRGCAYLANALYLIENVVFDLEKVPRISPNELGEVYLSCIANGKYGGTELGNVDGPLGPTGGEKARAYHTAFEDNGVRDQIIRLIKKSKRDHERFLSHFDTLEPPSEDPHVSVDISERLSRMQNAFLLLDSVRPGSHGHEHLSQILPNTQLIFTTYHPLILESLFSVLVCMVMLGEIDALPDTFERTTKIVAGLEGYPVFLSPRSMAQSEFLDTLERLVSGWKYGRMASGVIRRKMSTKAITSGIHSPTPLLITNGYMDAGSSSSSSAGPSVVKTPSSSSSRGSPVNGNASSDLDSDVYDRFHMMNMENEKKSTIENLFVVLSAAKAKFDRNLVESNERKSSLNITLHGARVETILVWFAAVYLPDLEIEAEAWV